MKGVKYMKKILSLMAVVFLVLSGIGAIGTNNNDASSVVKTVSSEIDFSALKVSDANTEYIEVQMEEVSTYLMEPGKPLLPKVVKTFELPLNVKNVEVKVTTGDVFEKEITKQVQPSPVMQPLVATQTENYKQEKNLETYSSSDPYPSTWYTYGITTGLNEENKIVNHLTVHFYPVRYNPADGVIYTAKNNNIEITYEETTDPSETATQDGKDMVIITPAKFENQLQRLVDHKNRKGVQTYIKTTESIYQEETGMDKPEQIKKYIKKAIEQKQITYVLLVGGLKSQIYAKPRDDANQGSSGWYVPVRYANLYDKPAYPLEAAELIFDPGVISDLYYADIYKYNEATQQNEFEDWDPNGDGVIASWGKPGVENDSLVDMRPDVALGRLACRSVKEVKTVVDKIIDYETGSVSSDWFNKMTVISGDGFLDQQDWNIEWDTNGLEEGYYFIYAQSTNSLDEVGPRDEVKIKIDTRRETKITFSHDDNLNQALEDGYPAPPITDIVSISTNDVLGYTDYFYEPGESEAYCNGFNPWANISYDDGVLTIRGKSYDPQPYGNITNLHVWIKDENKNTIFSEWIYDMEMYYEGEWTTGEKALMGRGGALYYMDGFEKDIYWTSNGRYVDRFDIINALNEGSGFVFMSGHGSPNSWGDQFPGIPGNRQYGSAGSLAVTSLKPWAPFVSNPIFPVDTLNNGEKLPVVVIGGCHNSQFNVSMVLGLLDIVHTFFPRFAELNMWCHGQPVPECMGWRFVRNPSGGAIATMGNTGLGYGMPGKELTTGGGDGWITIEFFRQYGEHGHDILGTAYQQTLASYIDTFEDSLEDIGAGHAKTLQQWVLLGDPSLKIGGYAD